jgi:UDP-glucose 4-epimerase
MVCLVTGGAGFLGSRVVRRLVAEHHAVRVLDPLAHDAPNLKLVADRVELVTGTSEDEALLEKCLRDVEVLLHFAGSALPAASNLDPGADVTTTLATNVRLFSRAALNGVRTVIFPSSGGTVYGIPRTLPVSESDPTNPITSYGIVKLASEKYLALFERLHGMRFAALRFGNPYGEGQDAFQGFGVVASFLGAVVRDRPLEIWGDGKCVRDFFYVEDAIEAVFRAMDYSGPERVFNIGSGTGTSINEVAAMVRQVTGASTRIVYKPARPSDVPAVILDTRKAEQSLGWRPKSSLPDGIQRTWEWLKGGGELDRGGSRDALAVRGEGR